MKHILTVVIIAFSLNAFSQIPMAGLLAYFPFSGNANDMSGNNYNGTLHGPTLTTDRFGNPNKAYSFDGINDYIDLNSYSSYFNIQQPVTFSLWVKSSLDNAQTIYCISDGSTQDYGTGLGMGNNLTNSLTNELLTAAHQPTVSEFYIVGYTTTNRSLLINNNWHHIVYVFNNVSTAIYLDNNLLSLTCNYGTNNGHYGNVPNPALTLIGTRYAGSYGAYFQGSMDDFRMYNRALSAAEITALYQETPCTAPVPVVNNVAICGGGVTTLTATGGTNYIWYNSSNVQIASGPSYTTPFLMTTTNYYVTNFDGTCESLRDTAVVTINLLPNVTIGAISDFANIYATPISMAGSPSGGAFSGNGVVGNLFNPFNAGLGTSQISYSYTDGNGCSKTVNKNIIVYDTLGVVCTDTVYISVTDTLIIDVLLSVSPTEINTIQIYPNPTQDFIIINTGNYSTISNYTLKIENNIGQVVFQSNTNQQQFQVNINDFGGYGLYFVKIINNIGTVLTTRKIILQ